jgi:hypothetical protein
VPADQVPDEETDTDNTTSPTITQTHTATPAEPVYQQEYTYAIPTSNPNGRTDLGITYLGTGNIVDRQFLPGLVERGETGAIQFEIRNYGTKTSGNWEYTVILPNGDTYRSSEQAPLKPNERALLSMSFPAATANSHTFIATVSERTDRNQLNNTFSQTVRFQ